MPCSSATATTLHCAASRGSPGRRSSPERRLLAGWLGFAASDCGCAVCPGRLCARHCRRGWRCVLVATGSCRRGGCASGGAHARISPLRLAWSPRVSKRGSALGRLSSQRGRVPYASLNTPMQNRRGPSEEEFELVARPSKRQRTQPDGEVSQAAIRSILVASMCGDGPLFLD